MKSSTSASILFLWPLMVLRFGSSQTQPDCELYDCSIARPSNSSANSNCTFDQLNKVGMHLVQFHPARTDSMGAFLDAAASVQNASCLRLTASLTLTVNMTETYSLNFMCDGTPPFFSTGFLLEGGCLRFYHSIDLRKCTVFRRERLRITNHVDGLTVANLDSTGGLIAQAKFTFGNASTGKLGTCDCSMFEKIAAKYNGCSNAERHGYSENLAEKYFAFGLVVVLLVAFVTAIVVLTSSKV